jgi:hypothetical protein
VAKEVANVEVAAENVVAVENAEAAAANVAAVEKEVENVEDQQEIKSKKRYEV